MEDQLVSFELMEKYLLIVGHGRRSDFATMIQASAQIYEKVLETGSEYVLVDYSRLEINLRMTEAYNIVKQYEVRQPLLRYLTIASVFDGAGYEFGLYWTEISRQRGFFIEIFRDVKTAETWLLSERIRSTR